MLRDPLLPRISPVTPAAAADDGIEDAAPPGRSPRVSVVIEEEEGAGQRRGGGGGGGSGAEGATPDGRRDTFGVVVFNLSKVLIM
jgi:hypothetical protein